MLRKLIFILLLPFFSFANTPYQTIKLAVYKNIDTLKKKIAILPPKLQEQIQIQQINSLYKASTFPTKNKNNLKNTLFLYQKVFHDAFITETLIRETTNHALKNKILSMQITSLYDKIKNKKFYLSTPKGKWGKLLFKVTFTNTHVLYQPILGEIPSFHAQYKVKNEKLYLFKKNLFNPRIYSTLAYKTPQYYAISNWENHIKINTIRYYFNAEDAKKYLFRTK